MKFKFKLKINGLNYLLVIVVSKIIVYFESVVLERV